MERADGKERRMKGRGGNKREVREDGRGGSSSLLLICYASEKEKEGRIRERREGGEDRGEGRRRGEFTRLDM